MTSPEQGSVLVAGASGFVGRRLVPALVEAGHDVRAMTRHPDTYDGAGTPVHGDVHDPDTLPAALEGCRAAYYLVHSLDSEDFERLDAEAATRVRPGRGGGRASSRSSTSAASAASPTTCRRTCAAAARSRACSARPACRSPCCGPAIIVGHGGISWEITRQLVDHLPAMVTPRWVRTRTQPIAVADVVRYLVGVLGDQRGGRRGLRDRRPGRAALLRHAAAGRRDPEPAAADRAGAAAHRPACPRGGWPWSPTSTRTTGRSLVDSMTNEVVVQDDAIREVVPFEPMGYDDAVRLALEERERSR